MKQQQYKQQYKQPKKQYPKGTTFKWPSIQKEVIDYNTYISSKEWKTSPARIQTLEDDCYQCRMCGDNQGIAVHHIHYGNLGKELPKDLCSLCYQCHEYTHQMAGNGALNYPPLNHLNKGKE